MSRIDEVRALFAYTRWANHRLLEAAAALPDDDLARDLGSSFPSVLATFDHIARSDWVWLRRWDGESPTGAPADWDASSLDAVRRRWKGIEAERAALLDRLDDDALDRVIHYRRVDGSEHVNRLDEMLRHVVNHSTYHRGQIVTMLRQLGATPPSTDLIAFYRDHGGG